MNDILEPCPFCAGTNLIRDLYYDESCVRCQDCGCDGPSGEYSEIDKLWNNRECATINKT